MFRISVVPLFSPNTQFICQFFPCPAIHRIINEQQHFQRATLASFDRWCAKPLSSASNWGCSHWWAQSGHEHEQITNTIQPLTTITKYRIADRTHILLYTHIFPYMWANISDEFDTGATRIRIEMRRKKRHKAKLIPILWSMNHTHIYNIYTPRFKVVFNWKLDIFEFRRTIVYNGPDRREFDSKPFIRFMRRNSSKFALVINELLQFLTLTTLWCTIDKTNENCVAKCQ